MQILDLRSSHIVLAIFQKEKKKIYFIIGIVRLPASAGEPAVSYSYLWRHKKFRTGPTMEKWNPWKISNIELLVQSFDLKKRKWVCQKFKPPWVA